MNATTTEARITRTHHATCKNCKQMVTIHEMRKSEGEKVTRFWDVVFHAATGTHSCEPVDDGDGNYSEPATFWAGPRAEV